MYLVSVFHGYMGVLAASRWPCNVWSHCCFSSTHLISSAKLEFILPKKFSLAPECFC